ncbi:DUF262 domain-containing protein [Megamonas funiformis]|uniref:DUF262 domain-containing protein n=1 Tax=Megamonas funiformis TaxID=437897 RepID=UPI001CD61AD8|nr:DUF262 domain-containing protein [Megamonas funiformis]UBS49267.1 DUF262 domain-containing protein [Megamonas funiformis]GLU98728.1 hypothetical protein Mfun01_13730 [Megamonas funiformis]
MQAGETTLNKLLNTSRQFIVPIFQRNYSWQKSQYEQLWFDILRASKFKEKQNHFIGSIVYIDMGTPAGRPQQLLLIDGQQRLTTISILLCAIKDYVQKFNLETKLINLAKIKNQFLYNSDEIYEDRYKLLLNVQDKETYIKLIDNTIFTVNKPVINIIKCYEFFYERIEDFIKQHGQIDEIYAGIFKLSLVSISLDKDSDNPQMIFESMNSTGKDLSQTDLLRNYLLMDLTPEKQTRLYKTYWKPMEELFGEDIYKNDVNKFDYFIRDFLTLKSDTGYICKINNVYENFKRYYLDNNCEKFAVLKDLFTYAKYYACIDLLQENDDELKLYWQEFKKLDSHVVYPFLLKLYDDYSRQILIKEDFKKILQVVISYLWRRAICEIPTNSLSKTFATLYQAVDKEDYVNSVIKAFVFKSSYKRFPSDYEVREKLQTKDIYHFRLRKYLLEALENYYHKEPIDLNTANYTIEHIMPQNIEHNLSWQQMLGEDWQEVHSLYLHSLGNLTITGYNAEMSNKSFVEKVNGESGFKYSHLKLSESIAQCDVWNKKAIQRRTNILTDIILKIWKYPEF